VFVEPLGIAMANAEIAIWTHNATPKNIQVIFNYGYRPFGFEAEGRNIEILVITSEIADMAQGESIVISSKTYKVASVQPYQDGAFSVIKLQE